MILKVNIEDLWYSDPKDTPIMIGKIPEFDIDIPDDPSGDTAKNVDDTNSSTVILLPNGKKIRIIFADASKSFLTARSSEKGPMSVVAYLDSTKGDPIVVERDGKRLIGADVK